tara:strand:- start:153 stop:281 length:129 start_codon:yes stop_codon:yes gene_type:complete
MIISREWVLSGDEAAQRKEESTSNPNHLVLFILVSLIIVAIN